MIKRTIGGVEWTGMNIGGTVSLGADVTVAHADALAPTLAAAVDLGAVVDVCPNFCDPGFTHVEVQIADVRKFETVLALLVVKVVAPEAFAA